MSAGQSLALRAIGTVPCPACRLTALRLFLGAAAPPTSRPAPRSRPWPRAPRQVRAGFATFRGSPPLLRGGGAALEEPREPAVTSPGHGPHHSQEAEGGEDGDHGHHGHHADHADHSRGDDTPWYLRVEPPRHPALIRDLPPLPEIPDGAPRLTEPLLEFVRDDLGLDDVEMLDLRDLDPPAALGSELLMIFGTARSDRHLHVSAGRLLRWLSARGHNVQVDGLVGRNELKTKLRRKARRAKLLGAAGGMGSLTDFQRDDGTVSEWICVNLGKVDSSRKEVPLFDENGDPVGFGQASGGTTIAVQMMTEARRTELDLETFYKKALIRTQKAKQALELARLEASGSAPEGQEPDLGVEGKWVGLELAESSSETEEPSQEQEDTANTHPPRPIAKPGRSTSRSPFMPSRSRFLSTSAGQRRLVNSMTTHARLQSMPLTPEALEAMGDTLLDTDVSFKVSLLNKLKSLVEKLPLEGQERHSTTFQVTSPTAPFRRLYDLALKDLPVAQSWPARLWLEHFVRTRLVVYDEPQDLSVARGLVREMQLEPALQPADPITPFPEPSREQYVQLIQIIYANPPGPDDATVREKSRLVMQVVDTMFERGHKVLDNDVLVGIIESLVRPSESSPDRTADPASPPKPIPPEAVRVLAITEHLFFQGAELPCPAEPLLARLLDAYAAAGLWGQFWRVWRMPPRHGRPRSAELYARLFGRFAADGHQARAFAAIRTCAREMTAEEPPVAMTGAVREAFKACVRVADPEAEEIATRFSWVRRDARPLLRREFVRLLREHGVRK